jgi:hypothetical protein
MPGLVAIGVGDGSAEGYCSIAPGVSQKSRSTTMQWGDTPTTGCRAGTAKRQRLPSIKGAGGPPLLVALQAAAGDDNLT